MVITLDGVIEFWSNGAEELYGYTKQEALGKVAHDLLRTRLPEAIGAIKNRVIARHMWQGELEQTCRDGRQIVVSSRWALRQDSSGQPTGFLEINRDISEAKLAERALQDLSSRLLQAQDDERRRLAQELHDSTAQRIVGLSLSLELVSRAAGRLDEPGRRALAESQVIANECTRELRTLSYVLYPPALQELGLRAALGAYVDGFAQRSGIAVDLHIADGLGRLPADVETTLFRVVQESLSNIHRHSGSPTASIRIVRHALDVVLTIRDRGHGLPKSPPSAPGDLLRGAAGVGIESMRERVRHAGGRLELLFTARGTLLKARVPV